MKSPALSLTALLLLGSLPAQETQGSFLVAARKSSHLNTKGGLFLVHPAAGLVKSLNASGDLVNSYSVAFDPYVDTTFWVGTASPTKTGSPSIYEVAAAGGMILRTTRLGVALSSADQTVLQLQVLGDEILFLTGQQLSLVSRHGGTPRVLLRFNASLGFASNFVCNGRDVFLHMQPVGSILAEHIYRVDLEEVALTRRIYTSASLSHMISAVTLTSSGNPLIAEMEVFSGVSELKELDRDGKLLRTFKLPFSHGSAGVRMDPGGSTILVAGKRYDAQQQRYLTGFITLINWRVFKTEFGSSPELYGHIDVRRHLPLHRYGHVCASARKWRAEVSASGLPAAGNGSYKIAVEGPPASPVLLLLGIHGGLRSPISLAGLGAATCELGVLPVVTFAAAIGGSGRLVLPFPIPSGLPKTNLDLQWLVFEAAANRAGFVTSQVGSVVVR